MFLTIEKEEGLIPMNMRLVEIRAALVELRKDAQHKKHEVNVISDAVYDELGKAGKVRAATPEEAREKVELQIIAMNIWILIGANVNENTKGLMRVIVLNGDASLGQKMRAVAIWLSTRPW